MLEELATVVGVADDTVILQSKIKSTCSSCQQVDNCGSGQVAKALPVKKLTVTVAKTLDVKLGDVVVLGIPEGSLLFTAWQVYLLPIFMLIGSAGAAQWLSSELQLQHELLVIVAALLGGYGGFRLAKFLQNRLLLEQNLIPKLLRKHSETINIVEIQGC